MKQNPEPTVVTLPGLVAIGKSPRLDGNDLKAATRSMQRAAEIRIDAEWCAQYTHFERSSTKLDGEELDRAL